MSLEQVTKYCCELFDLMTSVSASVDAIQNYLNNATFLFKNQNIQNIAHTLYEIGKLLNIRFDVAVSDGTNSNLKQTSFAEMFNDKLKQYHYHKFMYGSHLHTCNYHQESLLTHLILTMMYSLSKMDPSSDNKTCLIVGFTAILHDIGKVGAMMPVGGKENSWLQYSFHGELGAKIVLSAYNDEFAEIFSPTEWSNISETINVHMCGYHDCNSKNKDTQYKWDLLNLENKQVKNILRYLRDGDHYGGIGDESVDKDDDAHEKSRDDFNRIVSDNDTVFDSKKFMQKYALNGFVIFVRAMSASGKSVMVKKLANLLTINGIRFALVERDQIICQIAANSIGEVCSEKPSGKEYSRLYDVYISKNLSEQVNIFMGQQIIEALEQNKVVIIDTVMALYGSIEKILPPSIKRTFTIAIDITRGEPITINDADRMDISLEKQVSLHGDRNEWCPLPTDSKIGFKEMASVSSLKKVTSLENKAKPRKVFNCFWNNKISINYDNTLSSVLKLMKEQTEESALTDNLGIVEYINSLTSTLSHSEIMESFKIRGFIVKDKNNTIMIKYKECCQLWKRKWERDCRGVLLFKTKDNKYICLADQLQRGPEVLTGRHLKAGITVTEDMESKSSIQYDDTIHDTISRLIELRDIDGYLSFKNDGSLIGITCYSDEYRDIVKNLAANSDEFAKACLEIAEEMKLTYIPMVKTQTTFSAGPAMQDYIVTAMFSNIFTYEELCEFAKTMSPAQVLRKFGNLFFQKINKLHESIGSSNRCTFNFEAICKDRTTAWGVEHIELAMSYQTSSLKCLGMSFGTETITRIPHFVFSDNIINAGFYEPMWWEVTHASQIEKIMENLSKCMRKVITEDEFLELHKPNNKVLDNKTFDYEGFVFYRGEKYNFDYNKIKTEEYYRAHNFQPNNVPYLLQLYKTAGDKFPLSKRVNDFFGDLKMHLTTVSTNILDILNLDKDSNPLFTGLNERAAKSWITQPKATQMKMLVNASGEVWYNIAYDVFLKTFPNIKYSQVERLEINGVLKNIIMAILPWDDGFGQRIDDMITSSHQSLRHLFGYTLFSK
jgi:hypothetical protein